MTATRPNIILIVTDQQSYDGIGALGAPKAFCIRIGENAEDLILVQNSLAEAA